ncbi:unnamed protein product [Discosporangium mesarthrocarpum]
MTYNGRSETDSETKQRKKQTERKKLQQNHFFKKLSKIFVNKTKTQGQTCKQTNNQTSRYEAVHPVRSLSELKERLGQGRRCFAFLHPCVPGEPLVFVHVALLPEMARGMGQIREKKAEGREGVNGDGGEDEARWAIFYSITATQKGLKGVQLGNFLIKRVVKQLREELPQVESFATLSPIPSFRTWLTNKAKQRAALGKGSKFSEDPLLSPTEAEAILRHTGRDKREYGDSLEASAILTLLAEGGPLTWGGEHQGGVGGGGGDGGVAEVVLTRLAARYLTMETVRGKILDPVGHFHVRKECGA